MAIYHIFYIMKGYYIVENNKVLNLLIRPNMGLQNHVCLMKLP